LFTIGKKQKACGSLPQESSNSRDPLLKVKDKNRTERNERAFLAGVAAGLRRSEINKDAVVSAQLERIRVLEELNLSYQAEAAVANRTAGSLEVQLQRQTELAADLQRQLDTAHSELLRLRSAPLVVARPPASSFSPYPSIPRITSKKLP